VYIKGASSAEGFKPFISFPDLNQVYRGRELFPMFANRILSESRSDFRAYIEQLGLPQATTSPITILSRSSGTRFTDTLELFPLPEFRAGFGYQTWFWVHGMRYLEEAVNQRILRIHPDERIYAQHDVENQTDTSAIKLFTGDGIPIGFMPSYLLDDAHTLADTCTVCEIYVARLNPPPVPIQQRLLCRLDSCWPEGWVPYSTPRYQPFSEEASVVNAPVFN
jgi:hypothetical protein